MSADPANRPAIDGASQHPDQYWEARPSDIAGRTDLLLVDVRETQELTGDLGHIHGVRHIPMQTVLNEGLPGVEKNKPVVLICRSGKRSGMCAKHLLGEGFLEVYNLVGGMIRWVGEEHPIARTPTWK